MTKIEAKELIYNFMIATSLVPRNYKEAEQLINTYLDAPNRRIKFEDDDHSNCRHIHTTRIGINTMKCDDCGKQYPIIQ